MEVMFNYYKNYHIVLSSLCGYTAQLFQFISMALNERLSQYG